MSEINKKISRVVAPAIAALAIASLAAKAEAGTAPSTSKQSPAAEANQRIKADQEKFTIAWTKLFESQRARPQIINIMLLISPPEGIVATNIQEPANSKKWDAFTSHFHMDPFTGGVEIYPPPGTTPGAGSLERNILVDRPMLIPVKDSKTGQTELWIHFNDAFKAIDRNRPNEMDITRPGFSTFMRVDDLPPNTRLFIPKPDGPNYPKGRVFTGITVGDRWLGDRLALPTGRDLGGLALAQYVPDYGTDTAERLWATPYKGTLQDYIKGK